MKLHRPHRMCLLPCCCCSPHVCPSPHPLPCARFGCQFWPYRDTGDYHRSVPISCLCLIAPEHSSHFHSILLPCSMLLICENSWRQNTSRSGENHDSGEGDLQSKMNSLETYMSVAVGLAAAEQDAQTTAADQADQPSSVRSLPENGSLMPKVTDTSSCRGKYLLTSFFAAEREGVWQTLTRIGLL